VRIAPAAGSRGARAGECGKGAGPARRKRRGEDVCARGLPALLSSIDALPCGDTRLGEPEERRWTLLSEKAAVGAEFSVRQTEKGPVGIASGGEPVGAVCRDCGPFPCL
jgi:hypothetical protein